MKKNEKVYMLTKSQLDHIINEATNNNGFMEMDEMTDKERAEYINLYTEHFLGKTIRIIDMVGEPQYTGRVGVVESIDDMCQLHGTWGGLAIQPDKDEIEVID